MKADGEYGQRFSKSCKVFKKKKSLGFFILIPDAEEQEIKHREMLRIVNRKDGEYYVVPRPLDKSDFHISYHKFGKFHWAVDRIHHLPKEKGRDFRRAFYDYLLIQSSMDWIRGYCIAIDRRVSKSSLSRMLKILAAYVPVPGIDSPEAKRAILERRHITQPNQLTKEFQLYPVATGVALVELKGSPGELHTLNCALTEDRELRMLRKYGEPSDKSNEVTEISCDDIGVFHTVLM